MTGKGEHFYEKTGLSKWVKIPTAEDIRKEKNSILPPEKRAGSRATLQAPTCRTSFWPTSRPFC